jgi:hypothetical protein
MDLLGLERQFWLGTEAGRLESYISQGNPMIGGGWNSTQLENGCGKRLSPTAGSASIGPRGKRRGWSQLTEAKTRSSGPDTAGYTNRDRPSVLV